MWRTIDSSVTDVRKGIIKARIFTGTYILQKNRQSRSKGTVDAVCHHRQLEDDYLLHMLARCPAFYDIRASTIETLKCITVSKLSIHVMDWLFILKTSVCRNDDKNITRCVCSGSFPETVFIKFIYGIYNLTKFGANGCPQWLNTYVYRLFKLFYSLRFVF